MKNLLIICFTLLILSCSEQSSPVTFKGLSDHDTVYRYQNSNCYFTAPGINKLYEEGIIDSIEFIISTNNVHDEAPFDISYFVKDTFLFSLKGGLLFEDSIREELPEETINFKFYGKLRFHDTKWQELSDSISINIINPLTFRKFTGELEEGKRVGTWEEYYDVQLKNLARRSEFKDGWRNGNDSVFVNGRLKFFSQWKDGKKHGKYFEYWGDGKVLHEANFVDGKLSGFWYIYNSRGELTDSLKSL